MSKKSTPGDGDHAKGTKGMRPSYATLFEPDQGKADLLASRPVEDPTPPGKESQHAN